MPICIAILIPQLSMIINTIFLGKYTGVLASSQDTLAVMAEAGIYFLTLVMIGYGLANGLLMLMSRKAGLDDKAGLGKVFANGVVIGLIISLCLMLLSSVFAPYIFEHFIHEPKVRNMAQSFIKIRLWGLPFIILAQIGNQLFLASGKSSRIIIGTLTQTIVNIFFDYVLIFGNFGFSELGVLGAAYASVFAEIIYFVVIYFQIHVHQYYKQFGIKYLNTFDANLIKQTLVSSSPLMLQNFLSIAAWEIFILFVEHTGKINAAISQLLRSVFGLVGIATWALGSTCNSMVSNLIGQQKYDEVFPLVKKIIILSFGCAFICGLFMLSFPTQFLSILTNDAAIIQQGVAPLRIVVFSIWLLSISFILFNAVLGSGHTKANLVFEVVAIVIYIIYIYLFIEKGRCSLVISWCSEFVYWTSLLLMSSYYLWSNKWRQNKLA
jgi:putative MATE family efflux protein